MHNQPFMSVSADAAVEIAKGTFGRMPDDEPLVGGQCVLLREIVHALEILWGWSDDELAFGTDATAQKEVLTGLGAGSLVARVFRGDDVIATSPIIPRIAWPVLETDDEYADPLSSFWIGKLRYEQDCKGYRGELPVVERKAAVAWLKHRAKQRPAKPAGRPKLPGIKEAYDELYENGHSHLKVGWKQVAWEVEQRVGFDVNVSTLKRHLGLKR